MGSATTGVTWLDSGRVAIGPDARARHVQRAVQDAQVVQFKEPLPRALLASLSGALRDNPHVELYVYGHYDQPIDPALPFLDGFEHVRSLSLNLHGLGSLEGLERFDALRSLVVQGTTKRLGLAPLGHLRALERLVIDSPGSGGDALGALPKLRHLQIPAVQALVHALTDHPTVERLELSFGAGTDLGALRTLPRLRDVGVWQVQRLTSRDLQPVGEIPKLEALQLGALRHVDDLAFLRGARRTLRYIELESVKSLASYRALADCSELRAGIFFDARPQDRSLEPLSLLSSLDDLTIGDVYPKEQAARLEAALPNTRITLRQQQLATGPSRAHWRGLFAYVDERRAEDARRAGGR